MNVLVKAPNKTLYVHASGKVTIGDNPLDNSGEWVVFKPKKSRYENNMKVKIICCYKEIPHGKDNLNSIRDSLSKEMIIDKSKIVKYLENGIVVATSPGTIIDVLSPDKEIIGNETWYTDGKYLWCSELSYYIERYNLKLDDEFLNYIRSNDWKIVNKDKIDIACLEE